MIGPVLGCIADDYTGATDLSSMLVRAGMRVVQCFGTPEPMLELSEVDAVVVALKSRSIAPEQAVLHSLKALKFLQSLGARRFFFKYCSTFDSTATGNIGPVADALAQELNVDELIFCPAFPENGRTVYCGYLFVDGVPLHESSMRHHPLNPMDDSNLVRVLQAQSARPVALLAGRKAAAAARPCNLIADAIDDEDLRRVAEWARDHALLTGGSAIARYWVEHLHASESHVGDRQVGSGVRRNRTSVEKLRGRSIILAGSCSEATRLQIAEFATQYPVHELDLEVESVVDSAKAALDWCDRVWRSGDSLQLPLLISSSSSSPVVSSFRERWGKGDAAARVEEIFALIAQGLLVRNVDRVIVAGGETSGAVMNALKIQVVKIGQEIEAGVPWVESTTSPKLHLVLKSGNFGGPRFFIEALECAT